MSQHKGIVIALMGVALAGCGALADGGASFLSVVAVVSIFLAGCAASRTREEDGSVRPDVVSLPLPDMGGEAGVWSECCEDGRVSRCFCGSGAACNYARYCLNSDGTCGYECAEPDAGLDGGSLEPCCEDGVVTTCYCPINAECNYGQFCVDDSGMCHPGLGSFGSVCEEPDASPPITLDAATGP